MRLLPIILLLLITACSILPKPVAVHDFGVASSPSFVNGFASQHQPTINVDAPKWLYDNQIRYRLLYSSPTQVRFYTLDRWLASPPELLEQLLSGNGTQWPVPITINLQTFEQQFSAPGQATAIIQFTATSFTADNKQIISKREFNLHLACPSPDAKGAVAAFSTLSKQASQQIKEWSTTNKYN